MHDLRLGDCREIMRGLAENSVDSIVTDPPYELGFMGKGWDKSGIANDIEMWASALRVLKPGGHLLAFGGSRTYHRMVCAIEDAGFEIRDQIMWVYGSGFPKSLDVSKAMDKAAGAERDRPRHDGMRVFGGPGVQTCSWCGKSKGGSVGNCQCSKNGEAATDLARQWEGWGTALKPAHEPIVVARKPLEGTVAATVAKWGTGALNIDGCRVEADWANDPSKRGLGYGFTRKGDTTDAVFMNSAAGTEYDTTKGRWPANLIHDGSDEVREAFAAFGEKTSGKLQTHHKRAGKSKLGTFDIRDRTGEPCDFGGDTGTAARFFYCAKSSRADRDAGLEGMAEVRSSELTGRDEGSIGLVGDPANRGQTANPYAGTSGEIRRNSHPTVKPTALMRYLCRLVTPSGGKILDPFMGSGSTGRGALYEGFSFIGIETDPAYFVIAERRIAHAEHRVGLQLSLFSLVAAE